MNQGTSHRHGGDLSSQGISYTEHPKNMDMSQYSGNREGGDQGSKEVAEERSITEVVERM